MSNEDIKKQLEELAHGLYLMSDDAERALSNHERVEMMAEMRALLDKVIKQL